jgi:3D (Asp-Asp-Asp) domain-containing protein
MTVTAYSQQQFPGRGAHGQPVVGATAAASSNIPAFTVVWIAGVGARTINDRGHLGDTGHIDVFMATTAQAVQFGSSRREVCW